MCNKSEKLEGKNCLLNVWIYKDFLLKTTEEKDN